ncbi:splicing regulator SDE2-like [Pleurodeles waltl]|uniref:splicing regulator SDE2-like n=1 Tax=Pleurodeles waltl TaxID=8319 RepID=UPI0037097E69
MGVTVWVRYPFSGKVERLTVCDGTPVRELLPPRAKGYPLEDLYVKCNGRLVGGDEALQNGLVYSLEPRLCGGKGGFGSMLRALGAQIEKTTNREACRDLSGRRLRDVNHENAMADWVKKQAEREAEKEQRRLERLQRKLAEPKHYFTNSEYHQQCNEMSERLEDSVLKGIQASSSRMVLPEASDSRKRPNVSEIRTKSGKKKCFWTGIEGVEDSSSGGDESDGEDSTSMSGASEESTGNPAEGTESEASEGSSSQKNEACTSHSGASLTSQDHNGDFEEGSQSNMPKLEIQNTDSNPGKHEAAEDADLAVERVREPTGEDRSSDETNQCAVATEFSEKTPELLGDLGNNSVCDTVATDVSPQNEQTGRQEAECNKYTVLEEKVQEQTLIPEVGSMSKSLAPSPVDLEDFSSAATLEHLGLETLKQELMSRGLKCGGTLQERAARLFSVKGLTRNQIDPSLFAKPSKGKKK